LLPTILIVVALAWLYVVFAGVWTDQLWFDALGFQQVFLTQLGTKAGLAVAFGLVLGGIVGLTVWLVLRLQPANSQSRANQAYGDFLRRHRRAVVLVPALLFGLFGGMSGVGRVSEFLAWANQVTVGLQDARFHRDLSFYLFDYPWYRAVVSHVELSLGLAGAIAVLGHFALGTLAAPSRQRRRVTSHAAHRHIAILLAAFFVVYGLSHLLDRYGQLLTAGDLIDGLTYTGDKAQIGANLIMACICFLTAALFLYSCVRPGWTVPITSVVLMLVTSLIIGLIYPAVVQSLKVNPNRPDSEGPYIAMNIAATRAAYGVEDIEIADYSATTTVAAGQLKEDAATLPGIRLIDPAMVSTTFTQLQQLRGYYSVNSVLDVDRYVLNGKETDVVIAAREIDQARLDSQDWNNLHTVYTHGYGLIAAYGNRRQSSGQPEWLAYDIPTKGELVAEQPRIYFGESTDNYVVVGRDSGEEPIEFDMPLGDAKNTYDGGLGVDIGGLGNRLLYATRFTSLNLLLSDRVNQNSQILYDRDPQLRVELVAPWLTVDNDTYPALVDGRIVWVVDAYTTSQYYPNSQRTSVSEAIADTRSNNALTALRPTDEINYIRNSVKATVDAYSGEVKLYAWDESDPLLQTWMKVYPGTVEPRSAISDELLSHLRYPSDLFKIQRQIVDRYHVTDPQVWFGQSDRWDVPADPVKTGSAKEPSYYLSIRWPEVETDTGAQAADEQPLFSLTTVYTPYNRENLSAFMAVVAEATSPDYGRIRILRMSDQQQIEGPGQAFNNLTRDTKVANMLLPYENQGSLKYGNLLTIPLGGGLLYVEPVYTQQTNTEGAFPVLTYVVVRFGDHTGIADSLQGALDEIFSGDAGATTGEDGDTSDDQPDGEPSAGPSGQPTAPTQPTTSAERQAAAQAALAEAETQFAAAEQALRQGDLAAYQAANQAAAAAVQRALEAMG
jgi:uncharacterized membrane protein (UPF0182 family)